MSSLHSFLQLLRFKKEQKQIKKKYKILRLGVTPKARHRTKKDKELFKRMDVN